MTKSFAEVGSDVVPLVVVEGACGLGPWGLFLAVSGWIAAHFGKPLISPCTRCPTVVDGSGIVRSRIATAARF
jgi:hypothetical protein